MIRRFPWLARIGGSSAVTRWSWILTAPFAVTVMGSYITARSPRDWPTYFGVAVMVHLIMGLALLVAWLTVLRPDRPRHRPVVSLIVFAALGACRPFLLDALLVFNGFATDDRSLWARLFINMTTAVVALSLIAILVDSVREHDATMRRLRAARTALDEQRRVDEEYLAGLGRRYADDLAAQIDSALAATDRAGIDSASGARLLRGISEEIVRPMSHALFDDVTPPPRPSVALPVSTLRERLHGVLQAVRPAPLVLPVLLYTVVVLTYLVTSYGVRETVLQVAAGLVVCVSGSWVVAKVAVRIGNAAARTGFLAAAYSAVGAVTAVAFWLILGGVGFPPAFVVPGIAFYPFAALAMCLIRAANEQRALEEQQLATALAEQSHLSAEVHGRVVAARRRLAHVLHSSVQGELVAAALMMHGAATPAPMRPADGRSVEGTVSEILGRVLREVADEKSRPRIPTSDARQQITELVGMWSAAVPVRSDIDPDVWPLLSASPVRLEHAIDVLSEGFTNAIRHGTGGTLSLTMVVDPRTSVICIGIRSPGRISRDGSDGVGLTALAAKVGTAELVQEHDSVLLSVRLD
ncbi:hypothetical protein FNU77_19935 [Prescottella equi]|uniref:Signal transduction histidine kinase n=1 Tax=Rhodococcus hoagii TaxID=43767 RepID=A0AAE4ZEU4_RHOHA|nr:hypothetical protein [Prescottella equi]MBM4468862.1 hypothetical protein [Prescottella equi]MBM4469457.1 hypothetical protein [Prescottella equi]NKS25236.1 hypothetical protein [Prescottella equi]ORL36201.1 hypothetical protein A6I87_13085 [Prescottella equi]ORL95700.1 hypothetical protein A5N69_17145 [Prescottella equi]